MPDLTPPPPRPRRQGPPWTLMLLAVLAVWDLRVELQLLLEHFTLAGLRAAIAAHPLAIAVLLLLPSLQARR